MDTAMQTFLPTQQEQDDLSRLQTINGSILKLEAEKQQIMERLFNRYAAKTDGSQNNSGMRPDFDDLYQEHSFDYLKDTKKSNTRGMAKYCESKGIDFGGSKKPGTKIVPSLKKMPEVFLYDSDSESWSLAPEYA